MIEYVIERDALRFSVEMSGLMAKQVRGNKFLQTQMAERVAADMVREVQRWLEAEDGDGS